MTIKNACSQLHILQAISILRIVSLAGQNPAGHAICTLQKPNKNHKIIGYSSYTQAMLPQSTLEMKELNLSQIRSSAWMYCSVQSIKFLKEHCHFQMTPLRGNSAPKTLRL